MQEPNALDESLEDALQDVSPSPSETTPLQDVPDSDTGQTLPGSEDVSPDPATPTTDPTLETTLEEVTDPTRMESNAFRDAANWLFLTVPTSFGTNAWETIKAVPHMPDMIQGAANEMMGANGRNSLDLFVDLIELAQLSDEDTELGKNQYARLMEEFPVIMGYFHEGGEAWGDPWHTFKSDPFRLIIDLLPASANYAKMKGFSKTARILDAIDPTALPANLAAGAVKGAGRMLAREPGSFNPDVTAKYGQDATGDLTTTRSAVELAEDYGAGTGNAPLSALTDSEFAHILEESIRKTEGGDAATGIRGRDDATRAGISAKREMFVEQLAEGKVDPSIDFRNPEIAGQTTLADYETWRKGQRMSIGNIFEKNRAILDRSFSIDDIDNIFAETKTEIDRLVASDSGTRTNISNPDLKSSVAAFDTLLTNLKEKALEGDLTLENIDRFRTNYHQQVDLFRRQGMMTGTGTGSVSSRIFDKMTDDFYNLLEKEVGLNPAEFPENFIDSVKLAKSEWAELRRLDSTEAANFMRRHQNRPADIVEQLTRKNGRYNEQFMTDLKVIIGDEGWDRLKPALLNRVFQRSLNRNTGNITAGGLARVLADINEGNPNMLRNIFGDDMAKALVEMSEFQQRAFGKRGQWNTPYANALFRRFLDDPKITDIFMFTYLIGETGQGMVQLLTQSGFDVRQLTPSGIQVAISLGLWGALKGRRALILSDVGRQWLLDGYSVNVGGIKVDGASLLHAGELLQKHGARLGRMAHHAQRSEKGQQKYIQRERRPEGRRPVRGRNPLQTPVE